MEAVRKTFGDSVALRDVDLEVAPHTLTALIGASGSGKSTLLRCANLLEDIDDGAIWLGGEEITDPRTDRDAVRRRIGVVFQAYNLFPHMTVLETSRSLLAGCTGSPARKPRNTPWSCWNGSNWAGRRARTRTGSAAASSNVSPSCAPWPYVPGCCSLDEITAALDPELVGEILDVVRDLKDYGMTIVLATHEMGFAREVADQVCFLDGGVELEHGTPEQIFGDPRHERTRRFPRRSWRLGAFERAGKGRPRGGRCLRVAGAYAWPVFRCSPGRRPPERRRAPRRTRNPALRSPR